MDNKTEIINCALNLFSSHGYESVGVQEIVQSAGITKPTLYHYFGSKQGLLESILRERYEALNNVVRSAAEYNGDLPVTLYRVVCDYFEFVKNNDKFYRMSLAMIFAPPESDVCRAITPLIREQSNILEELFMKAAKDHGNMKGRHGAYAASFIGLINTYIHLWYMDKAELSNEVIFKAVHQFMHGIYS